MLYAAQLVEKALRGRFSTLILWRRLTAKVANKRVNFSSAVGSPKNYELLVVLVVLLLVAMVNPSFASNVANLATRRLIVPQGRRGMVVLQMGQLVALQLPLTPRKRTMFVWLWPTTLLRPNMPFVLRWWKSLLLLSPNESLRQFGYLLLWHYGP